MLNDERKDAIPAMVATFKKLAAKHWSAMKDVDVDVVMRSIRDAGSVYLRQTLMEGGVDVMESVEEVPPSREFLHSLPGKRHWEEEKQLMISALDHASEAHAHMSTMCAYISSLAKISNKETVNSVLRVVGQPLMQLNVPERFMNPVVDPKPMTSEEEWKEKLEKVILPRSNSPAVECAPRFGPT